MPILPSRSFSLNRKKERSAPRTGNTSGSKAQSPSHDGPKLLPSTPVLANFPSENLVQGAGVAIFHLRTSRVVLVHYPPEDVWFLPKGRRDVNEESREGAEREGFEEVCFYVSILSFNDHAAFVYCADVSWSTDTWDFRPFVGAINQFSFETMSMHLEEVL